LIDKTAKSVRFGDAPKWTLVGKPIRATVDGPGMLLSLFEKL